MSATLEECAQACLSDDACISFTRETVGTGPGPCTRSISCTHAVAKKEAEIYLTQRGMAVSDAPFPGKSLYEKGSVRAGPMPLTYYADRLALAANYPTKIITEKNLDLDYKSFIVESFGAFASDVGNLLIPSVIRTHTPTPTTSTIRGTNPPHSAPLLLPPALPINEATQSCC